MLNETASKTLQQSDPPAAGETGEKRRVGYLCVGRSCLLNACTLSDFSKFHNGWSKVEGVESFHYVLRELKVGQCKAYWLGSL